MPRQDSSRKRHFRDDFSNFCKRRENCCSVSLRRAATGRPCALRPRPPGQAVIKQDATTLGARVPASSACGGWWPARPSPLALAPRPMSEKKTGELIRWPLATAAQRRSQPRGAPTPGCGRDNCSFGGDPEIFSCHAATTRRRRLSEVV